MEINVYCHMCAVKMDVHAEVVDVLTKNQSTQIVCEVIG